MRSPPVFVDAAKNRREGSWRSSALDCVKETKEAEGAVGNSRGAVNPKDVI